MKINGSGSIEKRGKNSYRIIVCAGNDPVTGKRRKYTKTVRGTKAEAKRALSNWIIDLENGLKANSETVTFGEYARNWHEGRAVTQAIKPASLKFEEWAINKLASYIEDSNISELDPASIRTLYKKMAEDGASSSTLRKTHVKLKQILNSAVDDGIILKNPCDRISAPAKKQAVERRSLSVEEAQRLTDVLDSMGDEDSRVEAVRIALATGMRRGEVLGLAWKHIDLLGCSISIEQQQTPNGLSTTKTHNGVRRISIDRDTVSHLAAWKGHQAEYLKCLRVAQTEETPVISNQLGGFSDPRTFYRWFMRFCLANGFAHYEDEDGNIVESRRDEDGWPVDERGRRYSRSNPKPKMKKSYVGLKFHELRHTQATLLIANGVDMKTVSERLGHADVALTLNQYAHATPENDRAASGIMSALLRREEAKEARIIELDFDASDSNCPQIVPKTAHA